jgi:hypothetical protein
MQFGPYSRASLGNVIDPIRIATIYPTGYKPKLDALFGEFERRVRPRERLQYLLEFPGFSRLFGVRIVPSSPTAHVELPATVDEQLRQAEQPHLHLARILTNALNQLGTLRQEFDIVLILLPDKWQAGFEGLEDDFDLHDYIKAINASRGIPTQIILESSALDYNCRASVMWRLGIALYCKAGGVPWKLAEHDPETAFVGLSYAMRFGAPQDVTFVTCCSQVFDSDGAGLEFVAYETDDVKIIKDDPFLSRNEMRRVMARSLSLYQRRHGGRFPRRIVVHKTTEFKQDEVSGCLDAFSGCESIELYQIQQDTMWRGTLIDPPPKGEKRGTPAAYPVVRGSFLQLGTRELLMWTQGNAPEAAAGKSFYKEGKGIPHPIVVKKFAGHGSWDEAVRAILGLTKMNWNNDSLYDRLPVTLSYASTLAQTIKRMPQILPRPYEFRLFM